MDSQLIQRMSSLITMLRVESGYVNQRGEIYDRSGTFIDFPRELGSQNADNLLLSSVVKQFPKKTIACLVHQRINYSYYHWTYETLPKLIYLSSHRQEIKVDKIYYHCGFFGTSYQRQTLKKLGFNFWQLLDARRIESLQAKEIIIVKLNDERLSPSLELCQTIKSAFIKRPTKEPFRKIYLTRDNVKSGRKVANEMQLREMLRAYGFETVIPDNLTVANQAKLFNESKYIISPHGAALANIAFCEPRTKIIELFNQIDTSAWNLLYSRIAKVCNLKWIPLAPKEVIQDDKDRRRTDFVADLNAIKAILIDWGL